MHSIQTAMAIEQEYIAEHVAQPTLALVTLLAAEGYTLDEYFHDKRIYLLRNCNIQHITTDYAGDALGIINAALNTGTNTFAELGNVADTFVWHGTDVLNEAACAADNVPVYALGYTGGNIVTGVADLNFIFVLNKSIGAGGNYFLDRLYEYIKQYEGSVSLDNNDILIDGKKVIGAGHIEYNNMEAYTTQASFVDRSDAISRYCCVPAIKQPGVFKQITKQQLRDEVAAWVL